MPLLSMNESFTMEMFEALSHKDDEWSWYHLSKNKNTTLEYIESHPELPWEWIAISGNPNLTIDFIEKHEDKDCWLWDEISNNPNMTLDIIEKHIDKPWKWSGCRTIQISHGNSLRNIQIKMVLGNNIQT